MVDHLDALERDGRLLAEAAGRAGLDAPVPSCPAWQVRNLLRHTGGVHRWATSIVVGALVDRPDFANDDTDDAAWPGDASLLSWFVEGHAALVATLRNAPDDLECYTFLPGMTPKVHWARRQAHETAMHRADAQLAAGESPSYDTGFAVDGIVELFEGFFPRGYRKRLTSETPRTIAVVTTDADCGYLVHIGPDGATAERGTGDVDDVVMAPASDLYLTLWNRQADDTWPSTVKVGW
ncbi:MAG TPA: maleylpyruvate isomerase family mycothiol-dependent enzyme [Acidimicrobiales bacterium]|nr:maleylpyruvate isomerase family mycothiol-dependent enzyme [Acidimicrobiales bacterium]